MSETVERVTPGTDSWEEYGAEHMQRYTFFEEYFKDKTVIDAACGTGYGTFFIAESGAKKAIGIDIHNEAIDFSKRNYNRQNLEYKLHDCEKVNDLNVLCDLVVSFETIEHLKDPQAFVKNVAASLNKNGVFICSTPNKQRLSGAGYHNPFHPSELEWETFRNIFEKHFVINAVYHQTESREYMRYQELKHILHQEQARNNAFLFNRLELQVRKFLRRNFKPIPYMRSNLGVQQAKDIVIEPMAKAEGWHKTFIVVGKVKEN